MKVRPFSLLIAIPILLAAIGFAQQQQQQASKWLELAKSEDGTSIQFEQGTAKVNGSMIQFRFKVAYPANSQDAKSYKKPVKEVIAIKTADCSDSRIASNRTRYVFNDGTSETVNGDGKLVKMDPKSNLTQIYSIICNSIPKAKATN